MGVRRLAATVGVALALSVGSAWASGPGELSPWYIDQFGGGRADLDALYAGRLGIAMMRSPRPQLYIAWRLLHGQRVGAAAGAALSIPCCDAPPPTYDQNAPPTGVEAWEAARKLLPNAPAQPTGIRTERDGPNFTSIPNCFPEAFDTAAATLKSSIADHGAASPEVLVWLTRQDAVFRACHDDGVVLPGEGDGGPAWLRADEAYQRAALALYSGRGIEAADRFGAIARDRSSPWRSAGLYLRARALAREAKADPSPAAFAKAQAALNAVAASPPGTFGQSQVKGLSRSLEFRQDPARLTAEILTELAKIDLPADVALSFRDLSDLSDAAADKPPMMDWMATLQSRGAATDGDDEATRTAADKTARRSGLARALTRWNADHDVAWLVAALSLADAGDLPPNVLAAAEATPTSSPAWISLRHDIIRLNLAGDVDPVGTRRALDAILARADLSTSDRNVFTAQRLRLSTDLRDFTRLSLRQRLCPGDDEAKTGCVRQQWYGDSYTPSGVYDGLRDQGSAGFGEDARAVIDRLPLKERMAVGRDASLPATLRLDVTLTNFGRAVQLRDDAAIDVLCGELGTLLPQLKEDWRSIAATPPGAAKRFAVYLALAKIPGIRVDLIDYTRPEGKVADFQQYWTDWIVPAAPDPALRPPPLARYQAAGYGVDGQAPDRDVDLDCLGECGRGAARTGPPAFVTALQARAAAERAFFFSAEQDYGKPAPAAPPGALVAWNEMLTFAAAHPSDLRVPEALYWLIHVGHFGGSHDHSGRRAFKLLHGRYPNSLWAKKAKYYND